MLNHTLWDEPNTSFRKPPCLLTASLMAQTVKNLPAMWETRVWSLGRENLLEKEMATHSSILAWRIPRTEKPSGLQSMGSQRVGHDCAMNTLTCLLIHLSHLIATQGSCLHLRSHGRSGNNTKFRVQEGIRNKCKPSWWKRLKPSKVWDWRREAEAVDIPRITRPRTLVKL